MIRNCPGHGLSLWMIIQIFYAGSNFGSRNILDSASGGTFMEIMLGGATKLLDNIMTHYSQWHTERSPTSKKVHAIEEINSLSAKMDELMNLFASKSAPLDPNDMPLSALIESSNASLDVNFVGRNNFGNNNVFGGNYVPRPFPSNSSNNFGNSYNNTHGNYNILPSDLESNIKEFINLQKIFNASIEEKLLKIDDLAKSIDMSIDIDALKVRCAPPKINMDETLKAMRVSMIESKERTVQIRDRHEWLKKACSRDKNHEDLKVLGVTPVESLFSCVKPNNDGAGYESTLVEKCPNDSESIYLDAKSIENGVEDI
ncbi:hypothetical protein QP38_2401 [Levilactobacillus brevis]|nr:hypothetical protein QP38_2401 [Levilactobacillus brevis]